MSVQFTDNSDKIMQEIEAAIGRGLRKATSSVHTAVQSRSKHPNAWKSHVDESGMSATIETTDKEAYFEEFGKGEYAIGEKGSQAPTRPLQSALIQKKHDIENAIASELKDLG